MIDTATDKLFNQKGLCELLNISKSTLLRKRKEGMIPAPIRVLGQDVWPSSVINRWIIEQNPSLLEQVKPVKPKGLSKAIQARKADLESVPA